jgi:molybdopterin synthase catalytic subunit
MWQETPMISIRVQSDLFDVSSEIAALTDGRPEIGGIGCFLGTVRDDAARGIASRPLAALCLEHYPGMTERAIEKIVSEATRRWDLAGCTVIHRVGRLAPGEQIVLVVAASAHRQAALDATAFLIDWLKTKAPFWKREDFADGSTAWVDARETDDAAAARWGDLQPVSV